MSPPIRPASFPPPLQKLAAKVRDGERLDEADALACFTTPHLLHLGRLADHVRRRMHGDLAYYNINRHINPTNVCVYTYDCKFCGFAALPGEDHAWEMSHEEVYAHAARQGGDRVTEFHIVGGLHPELPLEWYLEMLRGLKERFPSVHLKAFTAIEIGWFARREKMSIEQVLVALRAAGLGSLPGGGAEIFDEEVRAVICGGKLDSAEWLEVHRIAHGLGIRSNCTMLYGHVEKPEHKVDHLLRLRRLQDETGGFNAFIPLAYHPENNYLGLRYHTTGSEDLRHLAAARLVLDSIPHVKAYWVMITPKLAQVALSFGADDVDGTVVEETIYHMAGAETEQHLERSELERIIRAAGFVPVQRDTLYNPLAPAAAAAVAG
ncbi:MAG: aminofutalosine synthase MqnE [Acidobacteriota bacterium]|nr:aminofutalosine synthase MqnE [Acidobacteriota bacterium]MDH3524980.1 aminofutalosine synthase MqnE [Acidobacteriota bacterium]